MGDTRAQWSAPDVACVWAIKGQASVINVHNTKEGGEPIGDEENIPFYATTQLLLPPPGSSASTGSTSSMRESAGAKK